VQGGQIMKVFLQNQEYDTNGTLPATGATAPDFAVTAADLSDLHLHDFAGRTVLLNIFPSIDTPTCACSVGGFNQLAGNFPDLVVLSVSADLPFALHQHCLTENIKNVKTCSVFREKEFGEKYGLQIINGPLRGLLARAVILIDRTGKIIHTEQVIDIANEPDYSAVEKILKKQQIQA